MTSACSACRRFLPWAIPGTSRWGWERPLEKCCQHRWYCNWPGQANGLTQYKSASYDLHEWSLGALLYSSRMCTYSPHYANRDSVIKTLSLKAMASPAETAAPHSPPAPISKLILQMPARSLKPTHLLLTEQHGGSPNRMLNVMSSLSLTASTS